MPSTSAPTTHRPKSTPPLQHPFPSRHLRPPPRPNSAASAVEAALAATDQAPMSRDQAPIVASAPCESDFAQASATAAAPVNRPKLGALPLLTPLSAHPRPPPRPPSAPLEAPASDERDIQPQKPKVNPVFILPHNHRHLSPCGHHPSSVIVVTTATLAAITSRAPHTPAAVRAQTHFQICSPQPARQVVSAAAPRSFAAPEKCICRWWRRRAAAA